MRQLASQKPSDPEQVYASGLYLSGNDQDRAALTHLETLPRSQWNANIKELADRQTDCATAAKSRRRKTSFASSRPLPVST